MKIISQLALSMSLLATTVVSMQMNYNEAIQPIVQVSIKNKTNNDYIITSSQVSKWNQAKSQASMVPIENEQHAINGAIKAGGSLDFFLPLSALNKQLYIMNSNKAVLRIELIKYTNYAQGTQGFQVILQKVNEEGLWTGQPMSSADTHESIPTTTSYLTYLVTINLIGDDLSQSQVEIVTIEKNKPTESNL